MNKPTTDEAKILTDLLAKPVVYIYAPVRGTHAKLVNKAKEELRPPMDAMCLKGWVSKHVTGCEGRREPPETHVTYTITALGRLAIDHHPPVKPLRNVVRLKSNAKLLEEANERD